jgi:hypothetical protein
MGLWGPRLTDSQKGQMRNDAPYLVPSGRNFVAFFRALFFAIFCYVFLEALLWILVVRFQPPSMASFQSFFEWLIQIFCFGSAVVIFFAGLRWDRPLAFGGKFSILMWALRRIVFGCGIISIVLGGVLTLFRVPPPWRPDLDALKRPTVKRK